MRSKLEPLLCELHAHTTWSDGVLPMRDLVDLYGRRGFDVLCVTDHVVRAADPWIAEELRIPRYVTAENHDMHLAEIESEGERARLQYGLLLLPGLELSYNDLDPLVAAHALAVGCREFVSVDDSIDQAMATARDAGAAIIAAHPAACDTSLVPGQQRRRMRGRSPHILKAAPQAAPRYRRSRGPTAARTTQRFARDWRSLRGLVDRYELFNRQDLYAWVARAGLPVVATGDFHRLEHLPGWKTLLPCTKDERAVVEYLRSPRPVYLTRLEADLPVRASAAA